MIQSADEFVALRTSDDPDEYQRAAYEPASEEVWLDVIERYPEMRRWVAHNKTVPLSILERLSTDPDDDVRAWVAGKRKLSRELMERLAGDPRDHVRARIASNRKAPPDVLRRLAEDPVRFVADRARERLAALSPPPPGPPPAAEEVPPMFRSAEEFVTLRGSHVAEEYRRAARTPAPEAVWLEVIERFPEMREWVAQNTTVPLSILQLLSGDPEPDVRAMVASRPEISRELVERLARDPHESVRERIASNRSTPPEVLRILLSDPSPDAAELARRRLGELEAPE